MPDTPRDVAISIHFADIYNLSLCMESDASQIATVEWTAEIRGSASIPHECSTPTEARRHKQEYFSAVDSRDTALYCSTTQATTGIWCGQSKAIALFK